MPADPGLLQFTGAVRTTLAAVATALLLVPILLRTGQPAIECSPVVLFVALGVLFARDATRVGRQVTVALAFVAGALAFGAASWLEQWPAAGAAGLLVLLGGAILLQLRGPRFVAIGLVAMVGYYIGLYLHPPLANQAIIALMLVPGLAISLLTLWLFPDDPRIIGHLMLASVAAQADRVVTEARHPKRDPRRLERHLMQLNRAIITAQAQLTLSDLPGFEAAVGALVNLEVAVTHAVLRVDEADAAAHAPWRATLAGLARAAAEMGRKTATAPRPAATATPAAAPLAWRAALRASCAGTIAIAVGYPLSPEHWYWAVICVFVLSTGTVSSGDTIHKGMMRVLGTACGALAGFLVAALVPAHPAVVISAMAVCVFGWSYFVQYNYAPGIFFLTLLLGLVYGVLGQDLAMTVWVRLFETAIGAAATFVTAMWIVPLPTSHHVQARALALIARLLDVIDASRAALATGTGDAPLRAMRRADHAMQELRTALLPLQAARSIALVPRADALPGIMVCVHWVRVLAVAAAGAPVLATADREALLARLDRLREHVAALGANKAAVAEPLPAMASDSASATLIAEAADRIEAALRSLFGRIGGTPREVAKALLA